MLRIAIVENEKLLAQTLELLLVTTGDIACLGVFYNGETAVVEIPKLQPDIVLMDIDLGAGINGIECIYRLSRKLANTKFLVLTLFEDSKHVFDALSAGAVGYIVKSATPDKILRAIDDVADGGAPMSPQIAKMVVSSFQRNPAPEIDGLSPREREIIDLIAKGKIEKEVAAELHISYKTVKTHITNIYGKLQVNTRVDALNKYFGRYK
jgi:DNA-binding NarL/FixJ family response regulator